MPGKFKFALSKPEKFRQDVYLAAIRGTQSTKPPSEVYAGYGPEDMGVAMVIRVQSRQEWNLVLPTDPNKYDLECGFTYGITSRRDVWEYVRGILVAVCRSSPGAFELMYEDGDMGDGIVEEGHFDASSGQFVVSHRGLPSAKQFELVAKAAAPPPPPPPPRPAPPIYYQQAIAQHNQQLRQHPAASGAPRGGHH